MSDWFVTKKDKSKDSSNEMNELIFYILAGIFLALVSVLFFGVPLLIGFIFSIYWVNSKDNVTYPKTTLLFTVLCAASISIYFLKIFYVFKISEIVPFAALTKFFKLDKKPELVLQLQNFAFVCYLLVPAFAVLIFSYFMKKTLLTYSGLSESLQKIVNFLAWVPEKIGMRLNPRSRKLIFWLMLALSPISFSIVFASLFSKVTAQDWGKTFLFLDSFTIWAFYRFAYPQGTISKINNAVSLKETDESGVSETIVLGQFLDQRTKYLTLDFRDLNHHIHILGQPGSGKSVLLRNIYVPQVIHNKGLMMIDLKADVDVLSEILTAYSHRKKSDDLYVLDLTHPERSVGYNPLSFGSATELKDRLINSLDWSEPYYKKVSERVLLIVLRALVLIRDTLNEQITLQDLLECISQREALKILSNDVAPLNPDFSEDIKDLILEMKAKDFSKSLSGLRADLEAILKTDFGHLFTQKNTINLRDIILNGSVFYVLLDGQNLPIQSKRIGRMLLSELRSVSGHIVTNISKADRPQFTVIVDEFADLVSDKESGQLFTGFLNRCRGSGIGVVTAHQSLGDFDDEKLATQVLDSTETLISFVQKDPTTCETLAAIVGTKENFEITRQTDRTFIFGDSETGRGSKKSVHEYIYHPNVFKNLTVGQAVYIAKKPSRHGIFQVMMKEVEKSSLSGLKNYEPYIPTLHAKSYGLRRKRLETTNLTQENLEIPEAIKVEEEFDHTMIT